MSQNNKRNLNNSQVHFNDEGVIETLFTVLQRNRSIQVLPLNDSVTLENIKYFSTYQSNANKNLCNQLKLLNLENVDT